MLNLDSIQFKDQGFFQILKIRKPLPAVNDVKCYLYYVYSLFLFDILVFLLGYQKF